VVGLRLEGGADTLADQSLVKSIERHSDGVEVLLAEETNAQDFLKKLIDAGAKIERFEMIEPSLNNIFIERVSESE
jgi:ABC-type uncharacterized transport system ATPase subunit